MPARTSQLLIILAQFLTLPVALTISPSIALAAKEEAAAANSNPNISVPKEFQFNGKPISPLCIAQIANAESLESAQVNLAECSKEESKYRLVPDKSMLEKSYIGYDYTLKNSTEEYTPTESAYYKYLGKFNNLHVIYFIYSGGGSGTFTSVFLVDRKDDTIKYSKNIVGMGDRCNGGIDTVSLNDNKLRYSLFITPYDYIDLSEIKIPEVKAYDDLSACAACCQGTAQFESDFDTSQLVSVDMGDSFDNDQGTYQECFNSVLKGNKDRGKQKLTVPELKDFVMQFKDQCLKKEMKVK